MPGMARVVVRIQEAAGVSDFTETFVHKNNVNFKNKPGYEDVAQVYLREPLKGRPSGPWQIGTLSYPVDTAGDLLLDINPCLGMKLDGQHHTVVVFYSHTPSKNLEFQQMVAECVGILLNHLPVQVSIFAAERTATHTPPVPPSSAFYGAGRRTPQAIIEAGFGKREYRAAGSWLGSRLESYIPGETRGLGVAIRAGDETHWFIDCAEAYEGDRLHWSSFEDALRGGRRPPGALETAFTKTMDLVTNRNATVAFVLSVSPQPRDMVESIATLQRAQKLHRLCQGF